MSSRSQSQLDLFTCYDNAETQPQPAPSTACGSPAAAHDEPRARSARPDTSRGSLFLTDIAVAKRYSVSRPTIWRWVKSLDGFPGPIKISAGTTRWSVADLEAWDEAQVSTRSSKTPRKGHAK
jgi:predicted DNA-binding transcriptional regulator AlpA